MAQRLETYPVPGAKVFDSLKSASKPLAEKIKTSLENPDSVGKSEAYFSAVGWSEKKQILLDEIIEGSRVLTKLSFDLEENLDFYNRATDKQLKKHILNIVFPHKPRKENTLQKGTRTLKELASGRPEKPDPLVQTGAGEQWRRRVILGIDTLLAERKSLAKIEHLWDHPDKEVRERFRNAVFYDTPPKEDFEVIFTPFALVIMLNPDDYDNTVERAIHGKKILEGNRSEGVALRTHRFFPNLSGRIAFVRKPDPSKAGNAVKTTRHELFHLYFTRFIRKKGLSKVKEHPNKDLDITNLDEAKKFIDEINQSLSSTLLEETAAYLFSDDRVVHPGLAKGQNWEELVTHIHENLTLHATSEEARSAIVEVRKAQALYLKKARALQISLNYLYTSIIESNASRKKDKLSLEEIRRNLLFLVSQWGPQRMDQLSSRLGLNQEFIDQSEQEQQAKLQSNISRLTHELTINNFSSQTKDSLYHIAITSNWLYVEKNIPQMLELCIQVLKKMNNAEKSELLLQALGNSIIVREQPLSQSEVVQIRQLISLAERTQNVHIHKHIPLLRRYLKEFTKPSDRLKNL